MPIINSKNCLFFTLMWKQWTILFRFYLQLHWVCSIVCIFSACPHSQKSWVQPQFKLRLKKVKAESTTTYMPDTYMLFRLILRSWFDFYSTGAILGHYSTCENWVIFTQVQWAVVLFSDTSPLGHWIKDPPPNCRVHLNQYCVGALLTQHWVSFNSRFLVM